jgi:hypothetical protein
MDLKKSIFGWFCGAKAIPDTGKYQNSVLS